MFDDHVCLLCDDGYGFCSVCGAEVASEHSELVDVWTRLDDDFSVDDV